MSGDNLVFEESLSTEMDSSQFIKKQWIYVNDNNSQSYSSQVVIDTTPLSNAGGWINYQEAFIVMPLVVQLTTDTADNAARLPLNTTKGDWAWAFKNGAWNMLNSMTVEFNNQNIIQQTSFSNVFRSFKAMTSFSSEDIVNEGADILFAPDGADSWSYCPATNASTANAAPNTPLINLSANGVSSVAVPAYTNGGNNVAAGNVGLGVTNNRNFPTVVNVAPSGTATQSLATSAVAGTPVFTDAGGTSTLVYDGIPSASFVAGSSDAFNAGLQQRQSYINYDGGVVTDKNGAKALLNPSTATNVVYKSGKVAQSQPGSLVWTVYAKLRLKDLHDYFEQTPLMRGATIRMYLNTNQAIVNFTVASATATTATGAALTSGVLTVNSVNVVGGLTCPLMIASTAAGSGSSCLTAGTYNLSVSIVQNTNTAQNAFTAGKSSLTACRLYAPIYYMNALSESRYLSLAPTRQIKYRDIFQYQFTGVQGNGGSFNFLVSNGINSIKSCLVVPLLSQSQPAQVISAVTVPAVNYSYNSALNPCSSAPATPDPIILSNFNILVSGVNLFLNNSQYDYENFREQLLMSNQLNANLTTGLTSGLIGEKEFGSLYRYYYGDCSRVLPAEENVSRSVQIVGTNQSASTCDLFVFVEFERSMTVDLATGARVE
jgi:hypothetical protein